jgi:hypothetical protein
MAIRGMPMDNRSATHEADLVGRTLYSGRVFTIRQGNSDHVSVCREGG